MQDTKSNMLKIGMVVLSVVFINANLHAFQQTFEVEGSLRLRTESKVDYNFNESNQGYFLSQFRLNASWQPNDWISLVVEGQDARIFGESLTGAPAINQDATPNIYQDQFDIHRAYLIADFIVSEQPLKVKVGRQKFNMGAQRLISSLEWVNTARVWDGFRVTYGNPNMRSYDVFVSRVVPVTPNKLNNYDRTGSRYFNSSFSGIYVTDNKLIPNVSTEYYYLYRAEDRVDDAVSTFGARLEYKKKQLDVNGEFAFQTGTFGGLDHVAQMVHFEVGYKTEVWSLPRISTAYNFGSGDTDPNDNKHQTFDNLYPLNHAYYGFMDLFGLQNLHNWEVIGAGKLNENLTYRIGWQSFFLVQANSDAWYNAGLGVLRTASQDVSSSHVGNEIDVTFTYKIMPKWTVVASASTFFKGDYVSETGNSAVNPNFYFLMTKYSF